MQLDRSMVELIQEIRRRATTQDKPEIKMANPDIFSKLIPIYKGSDDTILKALTRELFRKAGGEWSVKLEEDEMPIEQSKARDYRDPTQIMSTKNTEVTQRKPKRIYRGQIVA